MLQADIWLRGGSLVHEDGQIEKKDMLLVDGKIEKILLPNAKEEIKAKQIINLKGRYVFPGLVNTHTHLFQTWFKGLGRDLKLMDWLAASIRPNAPKLTREDCYYSAILGAMDTVMSGGTSIMDFMYANEKKDNILGAIDGLDDLGVRAVMGRGFIDIKLEDENHNRLVETPKQVIEQLDILREYVKDKDRMDIGIAGSVFWAISEEGFATIRDYADQHHMTVALHASETEDDNQDSMRRFGMRMFPYLESIGFMKDWLTAVHCVTLDETDLDLIEKYQVKVSYNPMSNLILGSGIPPMEELRKRGVTIGLGTDGAASSDSQDMIETIKFAALLQKGANQDPTAFKAADVLQMATLGGAHCLGLADKTGSFEIGKRADLMVYNPNRIKSAPVYNPVNSLVYTSDTSNVEMVLVDGKVIYRDGNFTTVNQEDVLYWVEEVKEKFDTNKA
ncbi:amidohydrolase [Clostridia bacterium]|nr:amidohydrolase [Clostridia bacterium]